MNPRIEKLKAERAKNAEKISTLQERNRKLSDQILKLENTDIIGMVREIGMTPEELYEFLNGKKPAEPELVKNPEDKETEDYEYEN